MPRRNLLSLGQPASHVSGHMQHRLGFRVWGLEFRVGDCKVSSLLIPPPAVTVLKSVLLRAFYTPITSSGSCDRKGKRKNVCASAG